MNWIQLSRPITPVVRKISWFGFSSTDTAQTQRFSRENKLIASRGLSVQDEGDNNTYSADDMSVTITGNSLSMTYDRFALTSCFVSEAEAVRRSNKDTIYYIAENGMLVKCLHLNDSALIQTSLGLSVMLDTILPGVPSGSGAKYEQGNVMFWSKGNTAMLVSDGVIYGHCVRMWSDEINRDPCVDDSRVAAMIRQVYADDLDSMEEADRRFLADSVDLNNDGTDEVFVIMSSRYFCGSGGCTWMIFGQNGEVITRGTVAGYPVYVSDEYHEGYRTFYMRSRGKFHVMKYEDGSYPSNPSTAPSIALFNDQAFTEAGVLRLLETAGIHACTF